MMIAALLVVVSVILTIHASIAVDLNSNINQIHNNNNNNNNNNNILNVDNINVYNINEELLLKSPLKLNKDHRLLQLLAQPHKALIEGMSSWILSAAR